MSNSEVIEVKINNLQKELSEMKKDIREHKQVYNETIVVMKENLIRLTTLMEKQDEQMENQDKRLLKQDETLNNITHELGLVKEKVYSKHDNSNIDKAWYQSMLSKYGDFLFKLILILVAFAIGVNADAFIGN